MTDTTSEPTGNPGDPGDPDRTTRYPGPPDEPLAQAAEATAPAETTARAETSSSTSPGSTTSPPSAEPSWRPRPTDRGRTASILIGVVIVAIGLWFFVDQTLGFELPRIRWSQLWPLFLIGIGGVDRGRIVATQLALTDWVVGDGSLEDRLTLADWRRQVAALYAEVRAMAAADPAIALAHWRAVREWLYRGHPQSPVPIAQRAGFQARHFEHDPRLRFVVAVRLVETPYPAAPSLSLPNSGSDTLAFRGVGVVTVPFPVGERELAVFWMAGYAGGLFIPFRDATNGTETYRAGRYLIDAAKSHDLGATDAGELILDFNFATQPSCAFDPQWSCPLAPPANRLDIGVRAGERLI